MNSKRRKIIVTDIVDKIRRHVTLWRVERALGFELFDWQIAKMFDDKPFPEHVQKARCAGKTTAQILFVLLCPKLKRSPTLKKLYGFPPELRVDAVPEISPFVGYEAARAAFYFGEDGVNTRRRLFFIQEMKRVKRKLNRAKIKTHKVEYIYHGRKFTV